MCALSASTNESAWRKDFPFLEQQPNLRYLDSAASTQKPQQVIDAIHNCYAYEYAPVHRGLYLQAEHASNVYEQARQSMAAFINSDKADSIVFTRSATESINLVARGWAGSQLNSNDTVWVTALEHHSNFLPWQQICRERNAHLRVIPLDQQGMLNIEECGELFSKQTKLIALTMVSNVTGQIPALHTIIREAVSRGICVLVDATQAVGHMTIDVQQLGCDFLVCSGHKMYGPTGIGVLYGLPERLAQTEPLLLGGGMVDLVGDESSEWVAGPHRFEAGSPNLAGAVGLGSAVQYLQNIGLDNVREHTSVLADKARARLNGVPGLELYGPSTGEHSAGIVAFNVEGVHPHDLAQIASEDQIAIRAGHHCCQPLMRALNVSSTARASFGLYNSYNDVDALCAAVERAKSVFTPRVSGYTPSHQHE